jgi:hypothetical protein
MKGELLWADQEVDVDQAVQEEQFVIIEPEGLGRQVRHPQEGWQLWKNDLQKERQEEDNLNLKYERRITMGGPGSGPQKGGKGGGRRLRSQSAFPQNKAYKRVFKKCKGKERV